MEVYSWKKEVSWQFFLLTRNTSPAISKTVVLRFTQVHVSLWSVISVGGAVTYGASILKLFGGTFNAVPLFTLFMSVTLILQWSVATAPSLRSVIYFLVAMCMRYYSQLFIPYTTKCIVAMIVSVVKHFWMFIRNDIIYGRR